MLNFVTEICNIQHIIVYSFMACHETTPGCGCSCGCTSAERAEQPSASFCTYLPVLLSALLWATALVLDYSSWEPWHSTQGLRLAGYLLAWLPVAIPIIRQAARMVLQQRVVFQEFTLMALASVGALLLGEYAEAVVLLLLYTVGEILQDRAAQKARTQITKLLRNQSLTVQVKNPQGEWEKAEPQTLQVGNTIRLRVGDRVPTDGTLLKQEALLDMSALTGESVPVATAPGETVLAGALVTGAPLEMCVTKPYANSTLSRLLAMVEEAAERKSPTERFVRRFARAYTPMVTLLALAVVVVPWVVSLAVPSFGYDLKIWGYRALVLLVTSCPCALLISVPLGFLGGLGAAARVGLLFKGAVHLDVLRHINTVVMDKTGTLTHGKLTVERCTAPSSARQNMPQALRWLMALEQHSSHPLALSVVDYLTQQGVSPASLERYQEKPGKGMLAYTSTGDLLCAGNAAWLKQHGITVPIQTGVYTLVYLGWKPCGATQGELLLTLELTDKLKPSAYAMVQGLQKQGIGYLEILSGDHPKTVQHWAEQLGIKQYKGGLLPADKLAHVDNLIAQEGRKVAFVGDGLNDAPVLARSHIGVAMGATGADVTVETADLVIRGDDPYALVQALQLSNHTHNVVRLGVIMSLLVKGVVMLLAILGWASLPLAILADVGVALLAVLNALRALYYKPPAPPIGKW